MAGFVTEQEEEEALRNRMADLLTRTAAAIKGPPPPLTLHDWADLPDRAAALTAELDAMRPVVEAAVAWFRSLNGPPPHKTVLSHAEWYAVRRYLARLTPPPAPKA